jgi:hypothetical protein
MTRTRHSDTLYVHLPSCSGFGFVLPGFSVACSVHVTLIDSVVFKMISYGAVRRDIRLSPSDYHFYSLHFYCLLSLPSLIFFDPSISRLTCARYLHTYRLSLALPPSVSYVVFFFFRFSVRHFLQQSVCRMS